MSDDIEKSLRALAGDKTIARKDLTEAEKDELVKAVGGPLTASSIQKALKDFPRKRIPFLFNSLDPQLVVDVLENDLAQAIERLRKKK